MSAIVSMLLQISDTSRSVLPQCVQPASKAICHHHYIASHISTIQLWHLTMATMGNHHISEDVKQITLKLWNQGGRQRISYPQCIFASLYWWQVIFEEHGSIIHPPSPLKDQGICILTCALGKCWLHWCRPCLVPSSDILHISRAVKRQDIGKLVEKMYITWVYWNSRVFKKGEFKEYGRNMYQFKLWQA